MGAYLAVSQGSKDGPEFIHLTYKPKSGKKKKSITSLSNPPARSGSFKTSINIISRHACFSEIHTGDAKKKLVLIGKGLTFDSGGYNLKAGAGSMIELMKFDMGGAGAVLGAAKALAEIAPSGKIRWRRRRKQMHYLCVAVF